MRLRTSHLLLKTDASISVCSFYTLKREHQYYFVLTVI